MTDEASKVNVNFTSEEILLGLPGMEPELVDSLLDYRDQDDVQQMRRIYDEVKRRHGYTSWGASKDGRRPEQKVKLPVGESPAPPKVPEARP